MQMFYFKNIDWMVMLVDRIVKNIVLKLVC